MTDAKIVAYTAALAGSIILFVYKEVAAQRGWTTGTFFQSGSASMMGVVVALVVGGYGIYSAGFLPIIGIFAAASFIVVPVVLGLFRSSSQMIGLAAAFVGAIATAM